MDFSKAILDLAKLHFEREKTKAFEVSINGQIYIFDTYEKTKEFFNN